MASVVWGRAFDGAGPAEVNGFGGLGSLIVCLREIGRVYYADHSRKVVVVLRPTANTLSGVGQHGGYNNHATATTT